MFWIDIILFARFIMDRWIFGQLDRVVVAFGWYKEEQRRFILDDRGPTKKRFRKTVVS